MKVARVENVRRQGKNVQEGDIEGVARQSVGEGLRAMAGLAQGKRKQQKQLASSEKKTTTTKCVPLSKEKAAVDGKGRQDGLLLYNSNKTPFSFPGCS